MFGILDADHVRIAAERIDPESGSDLRAGHQSSDDIADDITLRQAEEGGSRPVHLDTQLGEIQSLRQIGILNLSDAANACIELARHRTPDLGIAAMDLDL